MTIKQINNAFCRWVTPGHIKASALCFLSVFLLGLVAFRAERRNTEFAQLEERAETAEQLADKLFRELHAPVTYSLDDEADLMARMIYGYYAAGALRADEWELIAWVSINRTENSLWPDELSEVLLQDEQWQGFSEGNPILQDIRKVAETALETWHNGGARPVGPEFVYLKLENGKVQLRTEFLDSPTCRYVER